MCKNLKTIVYLTVNLVNHKIYVGVHNTETPDRFDGYIGNSIYGPTCKCIQNPSTPFHYAVKKYGYKNFRRYTLKVCDTREEALELEKLIVNEKFISSKNTYNVEIGGGDPPHKLRPVYFYDLEGNYLKEYPSLKDAAKEFNIKYPTIAKVIKLKKAWRGYFISYDKTDKLDIKDYNLSRFKNQIYFYNLDGSFYKKYYSYGEASKDLNIPMPNIIDGLKLKCKVKNYYVSTDLLDKYIPIRKPATREQQLNLFDLDNNYLRSYHNRKEAEEDLNISLKNLSVAIRLNKSYQGYLWTRGPIDNPKYNYNPRKIGKYDLDGNLIEIFESITQARKEYPNCIKVLKGYMNKCKGFVFKYIDE